MIVKELFEKADFRKIAQKQADENWELNHDNTKTEEEKEAARKRIREYIYECYMKIMDIQPEVDGESIVVCKKVVDLDDDSYYMDSFLVYRRDLLEKEIPHIDYDSDETENISMEDYEKKYIQHYAYEFEPWEKILGYVVAESCISEYGIDAVAGAVFDEMTFFGMEQDDADERKETEKNILEEQVKQIKENPDSGIPAEEVFRNIYEELGIDPPTEEEKTAQDEKWKIEAKINQAESFRIMTKTLKEFKK